MFRAALGRTRSWHEPSREFNIFQEISTSLMTSIYPCWYKVISQCQRAIRSPPLLIIALPQAASHPSSSAGSKQIICQTGRLQLNRHRVGGTGHAQLGHSGKRVCCWQAVCGQALDCGTRLPLLPFCGGALSTRMNCVLSEPAWSSAFSWAQTGPAVRKAAGKPAILCGTRHL